MRAMADTRFMLLLADEQMRLMWQDWLAINPPNWDNSF
jgi:hypothetical protein